MPLGRRRNRIDRSLRERGVPPEPQHREREVDETTGPWDEADAAAGRRDPRSTSAPCGCRRCRAWTCGSTSTPSRRSSAATLRDGGVVPAGLGVRRARGPAASGTSVRADLATSASGQGGSLREVEGPFGPGARRHDRRHAAGRSPGSPPPQPVRRPARFLGVDGPALVPARHDQRPGRRRVRRRRRALEEAFRGDRRRPRHRADAGARAAAADPAAAGRRAAGPPAAGRGAAARRAPTAPGA